MEGIEVYRSRQRKPLAIKIPPPNGDKASKDAKPKPSRKRKGEENSGTKQKSKKIKFQPVVLLDSNGPPTQNATSPQPRQLKITLKLPPPPKPKEPEPSFPCCLCISSENDGLLRVHDPPAWWYDPTNAAAGPCMAHEDCALIVPETWVDEVEEADPEEPDGQRKERVVFGVDGIVKDRWNLVSLSYSVCLQYSPFSVEMCGLRNT